jgi:predicted amidophosphoribosyltransferase
MTEKNLNTYLCKVCNKERAKDSKICPHCGTEEQHWTKLFRGGFGFFYLLVYGYILG